MATTTKILSYSKLGDPLTELSIIEEKLPDTLQPNEARIRILCSPINPGDLLCIRGSYPIGLTLPAVGGNEGVVEVVQGHKFKPGDRAVLMPIRWGVWRQEGVVDENVLVPIPKDLPLETAATVVLNPLSAYYIVKDILPLQAGDVIIQNAGNSFMGQLITQFANLARIKTINVVRNRENLQETVDYLKSLGAAAVITDEQLAKGLQNLRLDLPAPKLAIECVGGKAAVDLAAALPNGGTLACYGLLTDQPCSVSQTDLIFRNIRVQGYWLFNSIATRKPEEILQALQEIIELYANGKIRVPKYRKFAMADYKQAIQHMINGYSSEKPLLLLK